MCRLYKQITFVVGKGEAPWLK